MHLYFFIMILTIHIIVYLNYRLKIGYYQIILIMLKQKADTLFMNQILMLTENLQKKKYLQNMIFLWGLK